MSDLYNETNLKVANGTIDLFAKLNKMQFKIQKDVLELYHDYMEKVDFDKNEIENFKKEKRCMERTINTLRSEVTRLKNLIKQQDERSIPNS